MATIAKILTIPSQVKQGELSIQNALAEKGFNRHPGTSAGFPPLKGLNGKYLTGLDENADYINRLPPETREAERTIVRERRQRLEKATGLDLSPTAEYYSGTYGPRYNSNYVAKKAKLYDGENTYNFNSAFEEIAFWWITQNTKLIAPSLELWKKGLAGPDVQFYVQNPEEESKISYNENKQIGDAIASLAQASLDRRKQVGLLLGLPINENDKEEIVYNILFKFIHSGEITSSLSEHRGKRSVKLFNDMMALPDKIREIKVLIEKALKYRVYTLNKGVIYEGQNEVATNKEELITYLSSVKHQQELLALEIKVNDKIKQLPS